MQLIEKMRDIEETLKAMDEVEDKCLTQLLENAANDAARKSRN
jgi:hypothetical protein